MKFTIQYLLNSLAGILKAEYPTYPVYTSSNQQGTAFPCFFIFLMPSTISAQPDERFYRDLGIDIVFVQQRNIVNGNAEIQAIQEFLDSSLEAFLYSDGESAARIHTYEREASTEDEELHYKFHIRQRVSAPRAKNPMKEMEGSNVSIE